MLTGTDETRTAEAGKKADSCAEGPRAARRVRFSRQVFLYLLQGLIVNCFVAFLVLEAVQGIIVTIRATEGFSFDLLVIFPVLMRAFGQAITYTIPVALLFGTALLVGRLNADREIFALKSFGVSPAQMLLPAMAIGLVFGVISYFFNNYWVPELRFANRNVATLILDRLGYLGEGWNLEYNAGARSLWIYHYDGPYLEGIFLSVSEKGEGAPLPPERLEKVQAPSYPLYLFAERGVVSRGTGELEGRHVVDLQGVSLFLDNDFLTPGKPSDFMNRAVIDEWRWVPRFSEKSRGIKDMDPAGLSQAQARHWNNYLAAKAKDPDAARRAWSEYCIAVTEFHRRLSLSLTAFFFPLATFLLGLFVKSTNRLLPFFLASTVVPGLFFGFEILGGRLAKSGIAPWATQELGNVALGVLSVVFFIWIHRGPRG